METSARSMGEEVVARGQRAKGARSGAIRATVLGLNDGLATAVSMKWTLYTIRQEGIHA